MKKTVLILGGAGYIGSHTAYLMHQNGYQVVIIDKLLHNQKFEHSWAELIVGDFSDQNLLDSVFTKYKIDAVMHFAALIEVGISVLKPAEFYQNNVVNTLNFLNSMLKYNVNKIIFSSSCAIYGNPVKIPMDENHIFNPISPYGKNKLAVEFILRDYANAYNLKYVSLRYFNAAGADYKNDLGEIHNPETHIIPLILKAIKNNKIFKVFGTNYKTADGTCIRDYIHVQDLAKAHLLSLKYLEAGNDSDVFNLGSGTGFSVREIINTVEKVVGAKLNIEYVDRRPGDVDILIADNKKIKSVLDMEFEHSNIENIIKTANSFHAKFNLV
ncbi:UDP-glucose 4-epimerase GalE [Candidatus Dependentiae bacterium]|nr:UDP-glucose 4-epimerase GalE [Candidatus Dependentiae bacterium]MBU4387757.1 UDP-glucose 4-epimerase GalE [Candidatus Dependentiae bacterium]MCG2755882.1 UDP-glucose 4-epimerase GalE [Candidatus Dependentiae bacterium]